VPKHEYPIISRHRHEDRSFLFESPVMVSGNIYQVDSSVFPEDLYHYETSPGQQLISGLIDSRARH
jgi:hypothetical protein